jgi:hypothetical protein
MPVETAFTGLHIRGRTYCPGGTIALITGECRIKNVPDAEPVYDNLERLQLTVDQILPLHGRKVPLVELQKWIGKAS